MQMTWTCFDQRKRTLNLAVNQLGRRSWAAQIVLFFLWNQGVDDGVEGYDKNPGQEEWSVCRPALHNESCRVSRELAAPLYTLNWLSFRTKPGLSSPVGRWGEGRFLEFRWHWVGSILLRLEGNKNINDLGHCQRHNLATLGFPGRPFDPCLRAVAVENLSSGLEGVKEPQLRHFTSNK